MSASNRPEDLDEPSKYAPRWVREGQPRPFAAGLRRLPAVPPLAVASEPPEPASTPSRTMESTFEGDVAIRRMRMQRTLEPERIAEPQWTEPARFPFGMILRTVAAIGIATAGALVYVGVLPLPFGQALSVAAVQETTGTEARAPEPREPPRPAKMADRVGELRIPPAARAQSVPVAPAAGATVARLEEPTPDATRNAGELRPWPQTAPSWPPAATAPAPAAPPPSAAAPASAPAAAAPDVRRIAPEEIAALIKHGEAFVSQGDIAAARLMLRRAAEAGSARAALSLGGTYDSDELRRLGVLGFQADAAQARKWYEKAAALGSAEASRRLIALTP